jgi:Tol biopolymer transport system component
LQHPALAPDGSRVAVERVNDNGRDDLWLYDGRGAGSLLARDPVGASDAVWSPDGERLVFSRGEGRALVEIGIDGAERPLLESDGERDAAFPTDWSSDGEYLLYAGYGSATYADVWMLPLAAPTKPVPVVQTNAAEHQARFSPDGRWIAYASDESGRPEVYVRPMPPEIGRWTISTEGGAQPVWRRDGRGLFYIDLEGMLRSVSIEAGPAEASSPVPLFRLSLPGSPFVAVRNDYAVSADGQRFLVASVDPADGERLNVMVDWEAALGQ